MDFINKLSEKLDGNVRYLQYTAPFVASVGIIIILRKTYALSMFKNVHEIPKELISHNKPLRGYVEGVLGGRLLSVQHVPILFRNLEKRKQFLGEDASPFHVAIAGIDPRSGCLEHLQKEAILKPIKIVPLGVSSGDQLEAVIFINKGFFSRSVCLNESLVQRGLAVVHHEAGMTRSNAYTKLSHKLLQAEIYAERKGVGVWQRPSVVERLKTWASSVKERLPLIGKKS